MRPEYVLDQLGIIGDIKKVKRTELADVVLIVPTAKSLAQIRYRLPEVYKFGYQSADFTPRPEEGALEIVLHKPATSIARKESVMAKYKNFEIPLGMTADGPVIHDFKKEPHLLISGASGSGKSSLLHNLLFHLTKYNPSCFVIPIDFKGTELTRYNRFKAPLTFLDSEDVVEITNGLVKLMDTRYAVFKINGEGCKDIDEYNEKMGQDVRRIFLVVDELADVMIRSGKEKDALETNLVLLAQKARAAGIHLILSTQRPVVEIVTGNIKANIPARVALRVATEQESRIILDEKGAETLQPRSFYYKGNALVRGVCFTTDLKKVDKFVRTAEVNNTDDITIRAYEDKQKEDNLRTRVENNTLDGVVAYDWINHQMREVFKDKVVSLWDIIVSCGFSDPESVVPQFAEAAEYMTKMRQISLEKKVETSTNWYTSKMVKDWYVKYLVVDKPIDFRNEEVENKLDRKINRYANQMTLKDKVSIWKNQIKSLKSSVR